MFNNMREVHTLNTKGLDYVFTDLHGNYNLFQKALNLLDFDPAKDRVILAGDLCDRGKNSLECLSLLFEPWVLAVPGNHEQMLAEYILNPGSMYSRAFMYNGGNWMYDYSKPSSEYSTILDAVEKIKTLPRMITLKDTENKTKCHVLHAELHVGYFDTAITDEDIEDEDTLNKFLTIPSTDGEYSFWGRAVFDEFYGRQPPDYSELTQRTIERLKKFSSPNLSPIISGHTIMDKPLKFGKLINIDTGAYQGKLSVYCVQTENIFTLHEDSNELVCDINEIQ